MTSAPKALLDTRTLLLNNLDGLSGAEVGIVGDAAHRGGYHCGKDRLVTNDYSNRHARDRAGLSDYASALDVGQFRHVIGGKAHDLRSFSAWLVAQCKANAGDTRDIREVIYSVDGRTVKRWDRLGSSGTGDDSHLWHTHISVFRDATKAGRGLVPLMTRYLTEIGRLAAEREDDDVTAQEVWDAPMTASETGVKAPAGAFLRAADVMRKTDLPRIELTLAAILGAVHNDADMAAILARIDQRAGEITAAVAEVDEQVVERLGAVQSPQEAADLLRAVLGANAQAVGAILAAG